MARRLPFYPTSREIVRLMGPKENGLFMLNDGIIWLIWIPVSVILLVLLINTFIHERPGVN
jgi:hypothetical protein